MPKSPVAYLRVYFKEGDLQNWDYKILLKNVIEPKKNILSVQNVCLVKLIYYIPVRKWVYNNYKKMLLVSMGLAYSNFALDYLMSN